MDKPISTRRDGIKGDFARRGLIIVSNEFYTMSWNVMALVFQVFRPTHIEYRHWDANRWWIWGTSDLFEELNETDATPEYVAYFTNHEDGTTTLDRFSRV